MKPTFSSPIAAGLALVLTALSGVTIAADDPPLIVAHRGASGEAPENTLPAFKLAWQQGADAVEGDFRLTKDQRIVCIHDADTERVAGVRMVVKNTTLAELQQLDVGKWKGPEFENTRIPTLDVICRSIPDGRKLFLEIKSGPEIVPLLLARIDASPLKPEQLVVISFHAEVVRAVKAQRPGWTVNLLQGFNGGNRRELDSEMTKAIHRLRTTKADGIGMSAHLGLEAHHLQQFEQAGFTNHVWTVNDTITAEHFLKLGTRSITTDFPKSMRGWLRTRSTQDAQR